jgi:hypothetical protein
MFGERACDSPHETQQDGWGAIGHRFARVVSYLR